MNTERFAWLRGRRWIGLLLLAAVVVLAAGLVWRRTQAIDTALTVVVRRGPLVAQLTATGPLAPADSLSYRSPLNSRDAQITFLVAEGAHVNEGDLLAKLDTSDLQRDLERTVQEARQVQVDLQIAQIDLQEGQAAVDSFTAGQSALTVDETKSRLQAMQRKVDRLKEEHDGLKPLMDKGFITKEELRKVADELDAAQQEYDLEKRKADIFLGRTHPQDKQRAELQLAQKKAQLENVKARMLEVESRGKQLQMQIEDCTMYARRPGLVVYEEFLGASPRRKVRVGDRVTGTQGIVTLPDVTRMLVQASVSEADVHRLRPGQAAAIQLEAFPNLRLTGKVLRVGTLAQSSVDRPLGDKRFDLIVELDPTDADLRPEMTARVDVILGERQSVLQVPSNAIFQRQGALVCYVVTALGSETRAVQVGESNDEAVEVVNGLTEGERVALIDATATSDSAPAAAGTAPPSALGRARAGQRSGGSPLSPK